MPHPEQLDEAARDLGRPAQSVDHRVDRISERRLAQVAVESAEPVRLARVEPGSDDQPVEHIVLGQTVEYGDDRSLDCLAPLEDGGDVFTAGEAELEVMDRHALGAAELGRQLGEDAETEVLQRRHGVGQGDRAAMLVDSQVQFVVRIARQPAQPHLAPQRKIGIAG